MRFILSFILSLFLLTASASAQTMEIAALVNDEVVSRLDVEQRISLMSLSADRELTPDDRKKIYPQILRSLIDERLQIQEARRMNLMANEAEIMGAVARLAAQNNIPIEQFENHIAEKGGNYDSLLEQLKATISWTKVVRQKFATVAIVTEDEIGAEFDKIKSATASPEYHVAEIFLAVDDPKDEESIKKTADDLVQKILQGAAFDELARQFSQSQSATEGGDLGWVKRGQLPEAADMKLAKMNANQVTRPIRVAEGFAILFLREIRTPNSAETPEINRNAIADRLRQKKLESSARKYLRDLRSVALVDLRN